MRAPGRRPAICAIPLLVGFVVPLLLLLRLATAEPDLAITARFFAWSWNSLRVAALAAVLAVVFATLVAYAVRLSPGVASRAGSRVLTLGYAVPGTVLAVGVLLPLGAVDRWLIETMRTDTGDHPGLLLTGTVFALIYAYLVRYFAVAWNSVEPGFARVTPAMDDAARSLGAGTWGTLLRVHAPLLGRSGAAALLLVFVDVMKELPATLVLRPFNFDTLATQTLPPRQGRAPRRGVAAVARDRRGRPRAHYGIGAHGSSRLRSSAPLVKPHAVPAAPA